MLKTSVVVFVIFATAFFVVAQQPSAAVCPLSIKESTTLSGDVTCESSAIKIEYGTTGVVLDCAGHTVTFATATGGAGIVVNGESATVKNCKVVQGSSKYKGTAILVSYGNNNRIEGNTITTRQGAGITFTGSSGNKVIENTIEATGTGIGFSYSSHDNLVSKNKVSTSGGASHGVIIFESSNENTVRGNTIQTNGPDSYGVSVESGSKGQVISENEIVTGGENGLGVRLTHTTANTVKENSITTAGKDAKGVRMGSASSTVISGNFIKTMAAPISLEASSGNKIFDNVISSSARVEVSSQNDWNTEKQGGSNVIGGMFIGGNYWENPDGKGFSQECSDGNGDGVCDQEFVLDSSNVDRLPLARAAVVVNVTVNVTANVSTEEEFEADDYYNKTAERRKFVGPGGCSSEQECAQYCREHAAECGNFDDQFSGDFDVGFEFEIPSEVREADAGPEFVDMVCAMARLNGDKVNVAIDALAAYMQSAVGELGLSVVLDTSKMQDFKSRFSSKVDGICASNIDTLEGAINDLFTSLQFQEGQDPFDLENQIRSQIEGSFGGTDPAQIQQQVQSMLEQMQAAYAAGDIATGDAIRSQLETLQSQAGNAQNAEGLEERARSLFSREVIAQKITAAIEAHHNAELENQVALKQCALMNKVIFELELKDLAETRAEIEAQGFHVTVFDEMESYLRAKKASNTQCTVVSAFSIQGELESKWEEFSLKLEAELAPQVAQKFFAEIDASSGDIQQGLAAASQYGVNPAKIARLQAAFDAVTSAKARSNSISISEVQALGAELQEAWQDLRAEVEAKAS